MITITYSDKNAEFHADTFDLAYPQVENTIGAVDLPRSVAKKEYEDKEVVLLCSMNDYSLSAEVFKE